MHADAREIKKALSKAPFFVSQRLISSRLRRTTSQKAPSGYRLSASQQWRHRWLSADPRYPYAPPRRTPDGRTHHPRQPRVLLVFFTRSSAAGAVNQNGVDTAYAQILGISSGHHRRYGCPRPARSGAATLRSWCPDRRRLSYLSDPLRT